MAPSLRQALAVATLSAKGATKLVQGVFRRAASDIQRPRIYYFAEEKKQGKWKQALSEKPRSILSR